MTAALRVAGLHTHFVSRDWDDRVRVARALNGVSFEVGAGRILGVVGETGAGKSLAAMSVLGLLREPARVVAGEAWFGGEDLLAMEAGALNRVRGGRIGLVVQSPKSSLDPLARVGAQLVRVQRAHRAVGRREAEARGLAALRDVGIAAPERVMRAWAHELSGGMAQRVLIALALVNEPELLIADEPTTGLDVTVQAQILDLLRGLVRGRGIGALVITHDLGVVAQYCDDVVVMFAGHVVERGAVASVFGAPAHPYTALLVAAAAEDGAPVAGLGGTAPDLFAPPAGCVYRVRCIRAEGVCGEAPGMRAVGMWHEAACHFAPVEP